MTSPTRGFFIAIEGTDGSGKTEQTKRLIKRINKAGREAVMFDFPRHGEPSAWFVDRYLNGEFGTLAEIGPKLASLFYALDRFVVKKEMKAALAEGKIIVCNRYVASNLAHQGSKIEIAEDRPRFFAWEEEIEYGTCGIPKPDCNIVLFMPPHVSQQLAANKTENRSYLGEKTTDIHENNILHLAGTYGVYRQLSLMHPDRYIPVDCTWQGTVLSIEDVHEKIWKIIAPLVEC